MKPVIITRQTPNNRKQIAEYIKHLKASALGEVEPKAVGIENEFIKELLRLGLTHANLKHKPCRSYNSSSILLLNGSVGMHDDNGMGLLLNWVLKVNNLSRSKWSSHGPELITKQECLEIREGDVFVFDANKDHAWLSNNMCLLAQVTVKKTRKVKQ
jgi:hypothetical protein